jgi:hypothetical protein
LGGGELHGRSPISVVQRVARETIEVFKDRDSSKTQYGFLSVDNEENKTSMTVRIHSNKDKQNEVPVWDTRQISRIRYLPSKEVRRLNGKTEVLPEMWKGLIHTDGMSDTVIVTLDKDWIDANISPSLQGLLKELRGKDTGGYVLIPEGANESHPDNAVTFADNAPIARYWKNEKPDDSRRCVIDSIASGLTYLGHTALAHMLAVCTKIDTEKDLDAMKFCQKFVKEESSKEERRTFQVIGLSSKKMRKGWDPLLEARNYRLCLLGVQSSDFKTDHAICLVGEWIFDSNFPRALPLTEASLNICCSSASRETTFVRVIRGFLLKDRK